MKKTSDGLHWFYPWCVALLVLGGCASQSSPDGEPVGDDMKAAIQLNWFPESQHGGFYAAEVHGYFAAEGVEVRMLGGGPDAPVIQRVATGQVEFGVTNAADVLQGRSVGARVVTVMAPLQTSPRIIMVHADAGIEEFSQLRDLTLAMSPRPAFSHYLRQRLALDNVRIVPYAGVAPFLLDRRYAMQGYLFSEPLLAEREGAQVRSLLVADTGFNPYVSILVIREELLTGRPALVAGVVRAAVRGWEHYLQDPEATNAELLRLNPQMDPEILRRSVALMRPLADWEPGAGKPLGRMSAERWQTLHDQLVEIGQLKQGLVDPEEAFTTRFLPVAE